MANNNLLGRCSSNGVGSGGNAGVNSLRDVCNFLQAPVSPMLNLQPGMSSYEHLVEMIRGLDLQDDGIVMNQKTKAIRLDFCALVHDENMLCECMDYINDKALADSDTALKFALLFSSHNFDQLAMKDIKIRSAMLKVLEANFLNADTYRIHDKDRLYNSITLLGEYYNRVRLADQTPIIILGESLLNLLIREVSGLEVIDVKLAKLILSQITLNGDIMRANHKAELTQLLFHIRRNLIEQPSLKSSVKALLLMTLDLYYSNFTNLGVQLEQMYTKYLVQDVEDEGNNNAMQAPTQEQQQQPHNHIQKVSNNTQSEVQINGDSESAAQELLESQPTTMKWSEEVCEDSFYENDLGEQEEISDAGVQERLTNSNGRDTLHTLGARNNDDDDSSSRNARRSHKPRNSPRPLKHQQNSTESNPEYLRSQHQQSFEQSCEDDDQSKPLPRWRAPRFNRDGNEHQDGRQRNQQRRYSANFEDDQSVRSEGGSIRLYSINDRLRHSQEKIERSGNNFNSIANSNWDRQSQHDDRSERSYISNYERGNYRRNGRHYNNRHNYDKPPRFQKQQKDSKIHSDSWRRSRNSSSQYQDENSSFPSNGPESNSRSSSRARTLPRPGKSNFDGANVSSYRRSQSPLTQGQNQQQRSRNYNVRYSSQSSLVSETSSTFDRHNRNRSYGRQQQQQQQQQQHQHQHQHQQNWEDTHSLHGQPEESSWDLKNDNSELVRNARQTTKYMNYLSSKK